MQDTSRNIHTSPALFSLDRVMQGFRARSQILVSRLDDNDDVMQQQFSEDEAQNSDDDDEEDEDDDVIIPSDKDGSGRWNIVPVSCTCTRSWWMFVTIAGLACVFRKHFDRGDAKRGTYRVQRPKLPQTSVHVDEGDPRSNERSKVIPQRGPHSRSNSSKGQTFELCQSF